MSRALLIFLFISCHTLYAQPTRMSADLDRYRTEVQSYLDEIHKVAKTHSRVSKTRRVLAVGDLLSGVSAFNKRWATKAVLLNYFYNESSGSLNVYLIDEKQILAHAGKQVSKDSLLRMELELRNSIGVYQSSSLDRGKDMRGFSLLPRGKSDDTLLAKRIANELISEAMAETIRGYEQLLVSPTLNLYTFPFAALKPFGDDSFLGAAIPISMIPNLYEFCKDTSTSGQPAFSDLIRKATIVGNPKFNAGLKPRDYYGRNSVIDEFFLDDLPYTGAQTTAVRHMLIDKSGKISIDLLSQMEATKSNMLRSAADADLIYLATHGFSSARKPWDSSFVAFAREKDQQFPNFLSAREVMQLHLPAKLVVLSACQTGTGQLWNGGVLSLANAFYFAGADHVISTLWSVDDFFTSMYMREFMKGLIEDGHRHPSYYLHLVQKQAKSTPRHWAPFICYGK